MCWFLLRLYSWVKVIKWAWQGQTQLGFHEAKVKVKVSTETPLPSFYAEPDNKSHLNMILSGEKNVFNFTFQCSWGLENRSKSLKLLWIFTNQQSFKDLSFIAAKNTPKSRILPWTAEQIPTITYSHKFSCQSKRVEKGICLKHVSTVMNQEDANSLCTKTVWFTNNYFFRETTNVFNILSVGDSYLIGHLPTVKKTNIQTNKNNAAIKERSLKECLMVSVIELYIFIPVSVTWNL